MKKNPVYRSILTLFGGVSIGLLISMPISLTRLEKNNVLATAGEMGFLVETLRKVEPGSAAARLINQRLNSGLVLLSVSLEKVNNSQEKTNIIKIVSKIAKARIEQPFNDSLLDPKDANQVSNFLSKF